jgi:hypothetical protein
MIKQTKNYQSEYDRILTHMAHSVVHYETHGRLKQRKAALKQLGAQAIDGMRNLKMVKILQDFQVYYNGTSEFLH